MYDRIAEHAAATRDYGKAIAPAPDFAAAYHNRARAYCADREYEKAWADVTAYQRGGGKVHQGFLANLRKVSGRGD